jgi:hypothetical protein
MFDLSTRRATHTPLSHIPVTLFPNFILLCSFMERIRFLWKTFAHAQFRVDSVRTQG